MSIWTDKNGSSSTSWWKHFGQMWKTGSGHQGILADSHMWSGFSTYFKDGYIDINKTGEPAYINNDGVLVNLERKYGEEYEIVPNMDM